jgi:hypothetical protein
MPLQERVASIDGNEWTIPDHGRDHLAAVVAIARSFDRFLGSCPRTVRVVSPHCQSVGIAGSPARGRTSEQFFPGDRDDASADVYFDPAVDRRFEGVRAIRTDYRVAGSGIAYGWPQPWISSVQSGQTVCFSRLWATDWRCRAGSASSRS